ncbi:MAG: SapC family protein, partial [Desulfobacteraceae bacterium]|nr:SapC family protein [Desulfobacteraceae bacterium]
HQGWAPTNRAVDALADAGLICEWPLKVKTREGEQPVTGLYMIDETKLNQMEDDAFLAVRSAGALPIAYAQLLSMGNIQVLGRLADVQARRQKVPDKNNIAGVFGDDDILTFDNL